MQRLCSLALCGVFLAISPIASSVYAVTATPSWKPRELVTSFVNPSRHYDMDRYLAFDHFGNATVAVAYNSVSGGGGTPGLALAQRLPGVGWNPTVLEFSDIGYPSLAINRYESPVIAYLDSGGASPAIELKTYNPVNRVFDTQTVAFNIQANTGPSLALDLLDRPIVAAKRNGANPSYYWDFDGDGFWTSQQTTSGGLGIQGSPSLAVDDQGRWHAALYGSLFQRVEYIVASGPIGTSSRSVGGGSQSGLTRSLAINPSTGYPAMAYSRAAAGELLYAEWDGFAFQITTIDSGGVGESPSLAFDPSDGRPAIAYYDATNDDLRFAWQNALGVWQRQTVDVAGGQYPSLAFREFGGTQVAGISFFAGSQLYFRLDPPQLAVPEPHAGLLLLTAATALAHRPRRTTLAAQ